MSGSQFGRAFAEAGKLRSNRSQQDEQLGLAQAAQFSEGQCSHFLSPFSIAEIATFLRRGVASLETCCIALRPKRRGGVLATCSAEALKAANLFVRKGREFEIEGRKEKGEDWRRVEKSRAGKHGLAGL